MVAAPRKCKKCEACTAMIDRLQAQFPGRIVFRVIPAADPEAEDYGVVMPPMLILDDFLVSAGNVPVESGLVQLITQQLGD
jgi:hypothetical protein